MMKNSEFKDLFTPFEDESCPSWEQEYPRPQMKRESFFSLCGKWDLVVKNDQGESEAYEIEVPYPPESRISGIERKLKKGEKYAYRREFSLPEGFVKDRVILHFGAVDQIARVNINGAFAVENVGGYLPFECDITQLLNEENNVIEVWVTDDIDITIPYGKQSEKRGGMWYTPISGIWQSVWLESVCENYIERIKITPTLNSVAIDVVGGCEEKIIVIGEREYPFKGDSVTVDIENPILWSVDNPHLYYFTLKAGEDEISSYFALRVVDIRDGYICINGKKTFFNGVLDQGYYSDGIYTPKSPEGYRFDILTMKRLGFNVLRKHIKIEPEVFYYYCDMYGMMVFQDMVNNGKYHYVTDTVLPTLGMKRRGDYKASGRQKARFVAAMEKSAEVLYNHPSVVYYTIFNEGWGQFDADRLYEKMKRKDPTRVWDATSGWFKKKKSDVVSEHVYFRRIKLKRRGDKPLVLSEFGGYSYKIEENSFNLKKTYGYKKFTDKKEFEAAIEGLYRNEIIPCIKNGLSGAIITQLSDVEDETNGFVTYDRQVVKVDEAVMRRLSEEIKQAFDGVTEGEEHEI